MKQLIKIETTSQGDIVSARNLYDFLEVTTDFTTWCKRMFDYGFENEQDYSLIKIGEQETHGGHNKIDYALTLDCAKEISMLQRTDKGKEARQYFIECEKKLKSTIFALPQTFSEALRLLADTKEREEKALLQLNTAKEKIISDQPKVLFAESVTGSSNSILVRQFAKDLCDKGFEIGQNRVFEWLRNHKYINSDNEPYQNYVSQGLFEVITRTIGSGIDTFTTKTTKITGKGQVYFAQKIKSSTI